MVWSLSTRWTQCSSTTGTLDTAFFFLLRFFGDPKGAASVEGQSVHNAFKLGRRENQYSTTRICESQHDYRV